MIRPFSDQDLAAIVEMVQRERRMKEAADIEEQIKNSTTWVWDSGAVLGYAGVSKVHKSSEGPAVSTWIYTAPDSHRLSIGTKLWEQARTHIRTLDVIRLYANFNKDSVHSRELFAKHGFNLWFTLHFLSYDGPNFSETTLQPVPYTDAMFEDYVRLTNDGFRELRRQSNVEPADTFPVGYDEEEERQSTLDARDNIFFFYEDGKAIGYTQLNSDSIETITVEESCRGRGLGRKITKFSVNHLRQRGVATVFLSVLDVNKSACRLYESMGFEFVETIEVVRTKPESI